MSLISVHFRTLALNSYGLDPLYYISLPSFGRDAMLKMTQVELDYITDIDIYNMLEAGIRGGITTINTRHCKANNSFLPSFDPSQPSSYILYVDCNNLYGKAMLGNLPTGDYKFLTDGDVDSFDVNNTGVNGDRGFVLQVDLEYPIELHDNHNDFPLAAEPLKIKEDMLSPYNQRFLQKNHIKFSPQTKLCPNFYLKEQYVCSLENLQFYLSHGLILTKIHKILSFHQESFMDAFINYNSRMRQLATSKFKQDFYKLLNNSQYGKFIEDVRKRTKVDVCKTKKRAGFLTSKPQYKGFRILDNTIAIVQRIPAIVNLTSPICCGFMVLEKSKHVMMEFWYDCLKQRYGDRIELILSDTDSFIYYVQTENAYQDLYDMKDLMDLSGYPSDSPYYDATNRKVVGKFSDEKPREIIEEVIALKPKMYSIKTNSGHSITAKGISKSAQKRVTHEDYRTCLEEVTTTMITQRSIRSFNDSIRTIVARKRGLSAYDDKKYLLDNGVNTRAYGHYLDRDEQ